jgi:hypothetical protein
LGSKFVALGSVHPEGPKQRGSDPKDPFNRPPEYNTLVVKESIIE